MQVEQGYVVGRAVSVGYTSGVIQNREYDAGPEAAPLSSWTSLTTWLSWCCMLHVVVVRRPCRRGHRCGDSSSCISSLPAASATMARALIRRAWGGQKTQGPTDRRTSRTHPYTPHAHRCVRAEARIFQLRWRCPHGPHERPCRRLLIRHLPGEHRSASAMETRVF